jgi:hypothetical protein
MMYLNTKKSLKEQNNRGRERGTTGTERGARGIHVGGNLLFGLCD